MGERRGREGKPGTREGIQGINTRATVLTRMGGALIDFGLAERSRETSSTKAQEKNRTMKKTNTRKKHYTEKRTNQEQVKRSRESTHEAPF
jgi:hypothetical protein